MDPMINVKDLEPEALPSSRMRAIDAKECMDDLRLERESDISIWSFVKASDILRWYIHDIAKVDLSWPIWYTLEVNFPTYHNAYLIGLVTDTYIEVNQSLEVDEWFLTASWYDRKTNEVKTKRVWSQGA